MEVRNPILIDSRKGINKKTSNGNRKKRSDWNYDILKMPSVKSEIMNSNNDIDQNVFEIFKKELKEKQHKKRNKLISSENGSGETPIIDTDTDDTTIAPIIEESDNTTEERYSLINETDTYDNDSEFNIKQFDQQTEKSDAEKLLIQAFDIQNPFQQKVMDSIIQEKMITMTFE